MIWFLWCLDCVLTQFLCLVIYGGFLLDYFVFNFGKALFAKRLHREKQFLPLTVSKRTSHFNTMFPKIKPQFLSWLLQSMYNISQKNTRQLFYPSLLAEWRGLSRSGNDLFGKMKMLLPAKTYKRYRDGALLDQRRKVGAIIRTKVFCFWVDNFNKQFRKTYIFGKRSSVPYQQVDYTPFAISEIPNSQNLKLKHRIVNGSIVPAFPLKPTNPIFTRLMIDFVSSTWDHNQNPRFWQKSVARQSQTFNVPLKLEDDITTKDDIFRGSKDGLRYFHPVQLAHYNINSRAGLAECVKDIRKIFVSKNTYCMAKVDIDIFWKFSRVRIGYYLFI